MTDAIKDNVRKVLTANNINIEDCALYLKKKLGIKYLLGSIIFLVIHLLVWKTGIDSGYSYNTYDMIFRPIRILVYLYAIFIMHSSKYRNMEYTFNKVCKLYFRSFKSFNIMINTLSKN